MAQRTPDQGGNENLRATAAEERNPSMQANARESQFAERALHHNAGVTHANAGVQMLDLEMESAESDDGSFLVAQAQSAPGAGGAGGASASISAGVGKVIGTITLVAGDVKIMGLDGVIRIAQVGDKVMFKESIITGADGIVQIRLDNGQFVDVGRNDKVALDTDFFGYDAGQGLQAARGEVTTPTPPAAETPAKPAAPGSDVAALQAAIARGIDPTQVAPATAAGGAPAAGGVGGDGGGGSPVVIAQADTSGPVTAGFQTIGASITFPEPEFQLLPEEGVPGVAVDKVFLNVNGNSEDQADSAGDVINYEIRVVNTGEVSLTGLVVSDPTADQGSLQLVSGDINDNGVLDVGETWVFTAQHTVTQVEIDGKGDGDGDIDNQVIVTSNQTDTITAEEEVPLTYEPLLAIDKVFASVNGNVEQQADSAEDVINYTITVQNTGNVSLTGVVVSDPNADQAPTLVSGDTDDDGVLDVSETWTYVAQHTITQQELNERGGGDGDIDNRATVRTEEGASGEASEEVDLVYNASLTIVKSLTNENDAVVDTAGETIEYTITVDNTGNVDLTNVVLTDTFAGGATYVSGDTHDIGVLNTDEIWTYTADYVVTQADLNDGDDLVNVASVDTGQTDPQEDDATSTLAYAPVVQPFLDVFVADNATGQLASLGDGDNPDVDPVHGYRVIILLPTDRDDDVSSLEVTVDASGVNDGQLWFFDEDTGWTQITGSNAVEMSVAELDTIHYKPDADGSTDATGADDTDLFTYTVFDGIHTTSPSTVTLNQYLVDTTVSGSIGDANGHPMTSGSDNVALMNFTLEPEPTEFVFKTDFGPRNGQNVETDTDFSEFEIILQLTIDGVERYFRVLAEDAYASQMFESPNPDTGDRWVWTSDALTPEMFHEVTPSKPTDLKGSTWTDTTGPLADSTLDDYLGNDTYNVGLTWTVRYNDEVPGNQQARFVSFEIDFATPPVPTPINGTTHDDVIYGTIGQDVVNAGDGNDIIYTGPGNDILTGGTGSDTFVFSNASEGPDTITSGDFIKGIDGDVLDFEDLLDSLGYAGSDPFADGYLNFMPSGPSTIVQVDASGGGDSYVTLVTLTNTLLAETDTNNFKI